MNWCEIWTGEDGVTMQCWKKCSCSELRKELTEVKSGGERVLITTAGKNAIK